MTTETILYALGIGILGLMAYFAITGTNEAIDYQNNRIQKDQKWRDNNAG